MFPQRRSNLHLVLTTAVVLFFALAVVATALRLPVPNTAEWTTTTTRDPTLKENDQFTVAVNPNGSFAWLLYAGNYRFVNPKLTGENFPLPENQSGSGRVRIELVTLGKNVSGEFARTELERRGYRPATARELLALGAKYPELQTKCSVIALGSPWRTPGGHNAVAVLRSFDGVRTADLVGASVLGWLDDACFAAVPLSK